LGITFTIEKNTNMRVLLADDSNLILERLQEALSIYKQVEIVGLCGNGIETLEAIRTLKPDLAIIDIKMPGLTGIEVLQEIRKESKSPKIVILTFYSSDYYQQVAIKFGADYFYSKVDDFEKIPQLVSSMLKYENDYNEA